MTLNIPQLTESWQQLMTLAHPALTPIEDDAQLAQATAYLEELLGEIGEDAAHPLGDLARLLIERITAYEAVHFPIPDVSGAELLAFLMEQKPITQTELAAATGIPQSTISDLVNGKRAFTADHIRRLSEFFGVEAGTFL